MKYLTSLAKLHLIVFGCFRFNIIFSSKKQYIAKQKRRFPRGWSCKHKETMNIIYEKNNIFLMANIRSITQEYMF